MEVKIWSDIRCPFCYIGKHKFEAALEKFPHNDKISVNWHSFELDPHMQTQPGKNSYDYFSEIKGISREQAEQMHQHAAYMAEEAGLVFDLDRAVVANSFNAHRLIQFAKLRGLATEAEEQLFKAYFSEGKNIDDVATLAEIGIKIGLDKEEVKAMLLSDACSDEVRYDEKQAQALGIRSVPFFIFNDKYAVSGAQSPEVFLQVLTKSWNEYEKENPTLIATGGASCSADGNCG